MKRFERKERREMEVVQSNEQMNRLQRSIMGEICRIIDLQKVKDALENGWDGPQRVDIADVGPYKCLITLSRRRVWVEFMGIQVHIWSEYTFKKVFIQEKLTLEVGDRRFDVYAREFGRDSYRLWAHPLSDGSKDTSNQGGMNEGNAMGGSNSIVQ
ncbi:hypothetical protein PIB30_076253 [Stylosanthes scabra]|uniref:DUF4283 domain-containing protein n=1 Tax=Stylosanthes scabra TaxID=79078 RepID=A0ABU6TPS1_9FABA|nr:hypothetical protein [Stylosanthes scabra]